MIGIVGSRSEIMELWHQVNKELHDRFRQVFRGTELPHMALILLRHIDHEPGVTVSELARRSGTVKSYVSKTIDQLVTQGYVEKRLDAADQRLVHLFTTQTATHIKLQMEAKVNEIWSEVECKVPAEQLEDITRSLRLLLTVLQKSQDLSTPVDE